MTQRSYVWLFWLLALTGAALDQVSKYGVFRWLYNDGETNHLQVVEGKFELLVQFTGQREEGSGWLAALRTWSGDKLPQVNHGALFGLGGGHQHLANGVFALISLIAAGAIIYWSSRPSTSRDVALCAALGLILAGTMGNLYDRLVFSGVRDFLHFYWFEWPVFNVADVCLVCGAFLLLAQALRNRPAPAAQEPAQVAIASQTTEVGWSLPRAGLAAEEAVQKDRPRG
jgi:lipoprotein signal peptidase